MERADMVKEIRDKYSDIDWPTPRTEPIWYGRRNLSIAAEKVGIVIDYKGEEYLSYIASDDYKVVPYEEIVFHVEKAMEPLKEFGEPTPEIKILQDGRKFEFKLSFNECKPIVIREGQEITPNVSIRSSLDGMWKMTTSAGALVVVCTNGLTVGKSAYSNKRKHMTGLSVSMISSEITTGMTAFSQEAGIWKEWANRQLTPVEWEDTQKKLPFGKKQLPEVLALTMDGIGQSLHQEIKTNGAPNLWNLYMASTQFLRDVDSDIVRIQKTDQVTELLHKI